GRRGGGRQEHVPAPVQRGDPELASPGRQREGRVDETDVPARVSSGLLDAGREQDSAPVVQGARDAVDRVPWSDLLARSLDEYSTEGPIAVCVHGLSSPSVETVGPDAPKPPRRSKAAPSGGCGCGREPGAASDEGPPPAPERGQTVRVHASRIARTYRCCNLRRRLESPSRPRYRPDQWARGPTSCGRSIGTSSAPRTAKRSS